MTDLYNFRGEWNDGESKGPVFVLDADNHVDLYPERFTGKWLLTSEIHVTGGGEQVHLMAKGLNQKKNTHPNKVTFISLSVFTLSSWLIAVSPIWFRIACIFSHTAIVH